MKHKKKMIAPIVITVLIVAYIVFYAALILLFELPLPVKLGGAAVLIALAVTDIYVCKERIDEIRSGDEDDLGKY